MTFENEDDSEVKDSSLTMTPLQDQLPTLGKVENEDDSEVKNSSFTTTLLQDQLLTLREVEDDFRK